MRLLLVPPDTRPPTLEHPAQLGRMVGADVRVPPAEALPDLNRPGDTGALRGWLLREAEGADVLVACLETVTLGGMIPARRVTDSLPDALGRLEVLRELKALRPDLRILAFGVIVRVAHDNDPLEEKPYYGEWGVQLRAYSAARDRHERHGTPDTESALKDAREAVPADILADWTGTRERNRSVHLAALDLLKEGVLEHLCLTLDDTTPYGLAALDRRVLEARADDLGVWDRLDVYPGADEVPATLIARALQERPARVPVRVYVRYSAALGEAAALIYEDRPAGALVDAHLRAANCVRVDTLQEADAVLAVNVPGERQANVQPDFATVDTAARHLPGFVDFVERCVQEGRAVSVADIAYPNGAEARLWGMLQRLPLARLSGYAAWNTAGNTLGSAVAFAALAGAVRSEAARVEALFARMADDALYQGRVRAEVRAELVNPSPFDLGEQRAQAEQLIAGRMTPAMQALWDAHFASTGLHLKLGAPHLAWPRLFTGVFPLQVRG